MPDYEVTAPNGKKWVVTAPEGASQDEVLAYAKKQFEGETSPALAEAPPPDALEPYKHVAKVAASAIPRGFLNSGVALAQAVPPMNAISGLIPHEIKDQPLTAAHEAIEGIGTPPNGSAVDRYTDAVFQGLGSLPFGGPAGAEMQSFSRVPSVVEALLAKAGITGRSAATMAGASAAGQAGADIFHKNPAVARIVGALAGGMGTNMAARTLSGNARKVAVASLEDMDKSPIAAGLREQAAADNKRVGVPQLASQTADGSAPTIQNLETAALKSGQAPESVNIVQEQPNLYKNKVSQFLERWGLAKTKENGEEIVAPGQRTSQTEVDLVTQKAATRYFRGDPKQLGVGILGKAKAAFDREMGAGPRPEITNEQIAPFDQYLESIVKAHPAGEKGTAAGQLAQKIREAIQEPTPEPASVGELQRIGAMGPVNGPFYIKNAAQLKAAVDDTMSFFSMGGLSAQPVARQLGKEVGEIRQNLNDLLEKIDPGYRKAIKAYDEVYHGEYVPAKERVMGKLAGEKGYREGKQPLSRIYQLFDKGTDPEGAASDIGEAAKAINSVSPETWTTAVKSHLSEKLATAATGSVSKPDQGFLRSFFDSIIGTDKLRKGMSERLQGVSDGMGLSKKAIEPGAMRLFDAIGRAIKAKPEIAKYSVEQLEEMASSNPVSLVLKTILLPFKGRQAPQATIVGGLYYNQAMRSIDRLLSHPDGLKLLETLGREDPLGKAGQAAILSYLAGAEKSQPTGDSP